MLLQLQQHPMEDFTEHIVAKKKTKVSGWVSSSFEQCEIWNEDSKAKKCKFSRSNSADAGKTVANIDGAWWQKYAPQNVEELAVHKKKISNVEDWIVDHLSPKKNGAPILLLTGPPGCGKTTTLMAVAKKHGIAVEEWTNPLTTPYFVSKQAGLWGDSQSALFEDFLFRSGKYPSLLTNASQREPFKLILLEELPYYIYLNPSCFAEILSKYKRTQRNPLVAIISDGSSTDAVKRYIISHEYQHKVGITSIKFNGVSTTLMSKALSRIAAAEKLSFSKEELTELTSSYAGDIRAAINSMQFSSQSEALSLLPHRCSVKKMKKHAVGGKDTNLILFRALGKILYCKRDGSAKQSSHSKHPVTYRDPLSKQPEDVLDQCCLSGGAFGLFLHHNYMPVFENNPLNDLVHAAESFSLSDLMNSSLTSADPSSGALNASDKYEGILASRGLLYANSLRATADLCSKASGAWRPLHKPSWYQVSKQYLDNCANVSCSFWKYRQAPQELLCTTLPYLLRLHRHAACDTAQLMLLNNVVALPRWKLFHSDREDDRVTEHLAGDDSTISLEMPCKEIHATAEPEEDEEVIIEEFSE